MPSDPTGAARAARYRLRRAEAGQQYVTAWISPDAAARLNRLCAETGKTRGQVLSDLLMKIDPQQERT